MRSNGSTTLWDCSERRSAVLAGEDGAVQGHEAAALRRAYGFVVFPSVSPLHSVVGGSSASPGLFMGAPLRTRRRIALPNELLLSHSPSRPDRTALPEATRVS